MLPQIINFGQLSSFYLQITPSYHWGHYVLCIQRVHIAHIPIKRSRYMYSFIYYIYLVLLKEVFSMFYFLYKILPIVDKNVDFYLFFAENIFFLVFFRFSEVVSQRCYMEKLSCRIKHAILQKKFFILVVFLWIL